MRSLATLVAALWLPLAAAQQETEPDEKDTPETTSTERDEALYPKVKMETTMGDIVLELNVEAAPITVDNFIKYAESGYYAGTVFHRCMADFMIQGGGFTEEMDKKQEGLRDPIKNEWQNGLKNERGTIAMARTNEPDSATSQFFINVVDNGRLDEPSGGAAYCVFGKVVEGLDVVDGIRNCEKIKHPKYPAPQPVTPKEPIVIKSVTPVGEFDRDKLAARIEMARKKLEAEDKLRKEEQAVREKERDDRATAFKALLEKKEDAEGRKLEATDSGLMYVILKPGDGPAPEKTDTVTVHYTGWLMSGKMFDSSVKRGQPATFLLSGVIAGWTEGVGLMKVGEQRRLVIPADLAYGPRGRPGIPPNSMLVFDVELLGIE